MGTKERSRKGNTISIWLNREIQDNLDDSAKRVNLSRNKLIENLLDVGLEEIGILKHVGIFRLSMAIENLRQQWRVSQESSDEDKSKTPRGSNITVWLDEKVIDTLEDLAKGLDLSRSKLIEHLLEMGIRDFKYLDKSGIIPMALYIQGLRDKWKKRFKDTENSLKKGKINLE